MSISCDKPASQKLWGQLWEVLIEKSQVWLARNQIIKWNAIAALPSLILMMLLLLTRIWSGFGFARRHSIRRKLTSRWVGYPSSSPMKLSVASARWRCCSSSCFCMFLLRRLQSPAVFIDSGRSDSVCLIFLRQRVRCRQRGVEQDRAGYGVARLGLL